MRAIGSGESGLRILALIWLLSDYLVCEYIVILTHRFLVSGVRFKLAKLART